MIGDVKMQTIKRRTGRSLTGDRPLFLALKADICLKGTGFLAPKVSALDRFHFILVGRPVLSK